jgi:dephospho-CoA kinase
MRIVGVVGFPASGKGEFSVIAREMGIPVIVMGDAIRKACADEGTAPTDENLGAMGTKLRKRLGRDAIAQLTIPEIESQAAPLVLVDGIRSDAEVLTFKNHFPDFILIGIHSSFETRFQRLRDRQRSDDPADEAHLRMRDEREIGWGLDRALDMVDCTINNEGTLDEFRREVEKIFIRLGRV